MKTSVTLYSFSQYVNAGKLTQLDCIAKAKELGFDGNAKEALAFAILANEAIFAHANNVPSVTGAKHPVVMGKISL